jgi:hypothetical protein
LKLYDELADWWPLLDAPEDCAERLSFVHSALPDRGLDVFTGRAAP